MTPPLVPCAGSPEGRSSGRFVRAVVPEEDEYAERRPGHGSLTIGHDAEGAVHRQSIHGRSDGSVMHDRSRASMNENTDRPEPVNVSQRHERPIATPLSHPLLRVHAAPRRCVIDKRWLQPRARERLL